MQNKETVNDKIQWVKNYLSDQGIDSPRLEAEILIGHVLGMGRIELYRDLLQLFPEDESGPLLELVQKRAERVPMAYLIGQQEFMSLDFIVSPDVLIPRPETEMLVEYLIAKLKAHKEPLIIDVGTGSGAIAVSLAKYLPTAKIVAVDVSKAALQVAKKNAELNQVAQQITFLESNLLEAVDLTYAGKVTAIAANLPYIPEGERAKLQPEVGLYEPDLALYAGADGFDLYRKLIPLAHRYLVQGGILTMEIGFDQGDLAVANLSEEQWQGININKDFQNLDRLVCACKKGANSI